MTKYSIGDIIENPSDNNRYEITDVLKKTYICKLVDDENYVGGIAIETADEKWKKVR